jgi:CRP-like cAMP-binding protein
MNNPTRFLPFLRQGHWFGALPVPLQELIVRRSVVRTFGRGEYIIREGTPARGMYVVLEGKVRVTHRVGDGNEALIHVGETGLWFGERAMLAGETSIGSIVADSPVATLFLPVAEFERIVADEPRYYRCFARLVMDRYAYLFRHVAEAQVLPSEAWLLTRLSDLAAMRQQDFPVAGPVDVPASQPELATMVGVSRQTLGTLLAKLQARGQVEVGLRSVRVLPRMELAANDG